MTVGDSSANAATRAGIVLLALLTGVLTGCAPVSDREPAGGGPAEATAPSGQQPSLPAGWRWESYGGVQVGVPGDWGWGNGSQRLGQWCVDRVGGGVDPEVGRPGAATLVGCPVEGATDPGTLVEKTGQVVAFDRTEDPSAGIDHEGDRTTVRLNGVLVIVQTPADLRQRIVATVHRVEVDSFGCPSTHPISAAAAHRPAGPVRVEALREVTEVSACRYQLDASGRPDARLLSALRLVGQPATEAVRRIAQAPAGGGPDNPQACLPDSSYGDEIIVLRVRSSADLTEIVLRYAGCDHHGFDDGVTVRSLTSEAVAPFLAEPNSLPDQWRSIRKP